MRHIRPDERGAALLTVLLLVAVMAVVSATAIERLTLTTRLAASSGIAGQARQGQLAAEAMAVQRIALRRASSPYQTTLEGGWMDRGMTLPLAGGGAELQLSDGGNCFNLNSLVSRSDMTVQPHAIAQFVALMQALGIDEGTAQHIAMSSADWIDPDQAAQPNGAEDSAYSGYRTPDMPMSDAGELTVVSGMTPVIWAKLKPWVCALPSDAISTINVNTLRPEQAPLLVMLAPASLSATQARSLLATRPPGGYGRIERFTELLKAQGISLPEDANRSLTLTSRWFRMHSQIGIGDVRFTWVSLIDAGEPTKMPLVARRAWGPEE